MSVNADETLIKPVLDTTYGQLITIPLGTDTLALQYITWSGLDELLQKPTTPLADTTGEQYSRLVSDTDSLPIQHLGDGVRFDRTYEFLLENSMWIYKTTIVIASAIAVTAYTSGNISVDSINYLITEETLDGTVVQTLADQTIQTDMATITSAVNSVAIVRIETNTPVRVSQGNVLRIKITFNTTDSGTATTFEGIMPLFYFQEGAGVKLLAESAVMLHVLPTLDSTFTVIRDQTTDAQLDYGGVQRNGIIRGIIAATRQQINILSDSLKGGFKR